MDTVKKMDENNKKEILVIGHRGAPREAPENTISSFERALKVGVGMVEADLRRTSDGRVVVIHDRDVRRTTNGRGRVDAMTEDQLMELDAGGWFSKKYCGEKIPTLDALLAWASAVEIKLVLELKDNEIEEFVVRRIAAHEMEGKVIICSWKFGALEKVKALAPNMEVAPILVSANRIKPAVIALKPSMVFLWTGYAMTPGVVQSLQSHGIKVMAWVVDSKPLLARALNRKVDGVITNEVSITTSFLTIEYVKA